MANIILQAQNQIMSASKEDIYCLLAYLHILQGDRLCTDEVAALRSMLADVEAYQSNPHGHRPTNYIAVARAALALAGKVGE